MKSYNRSLLFWFGISLALLLAGNVLVTRFFPVADLQYFRDCAVRLLQGQWVYRDFFFDYPPLAFIPMLLPMLVTLDPSVDITTYTWLFSLANWGLSWLLVAVLARIAVVLNYPAVLTIKRVMGLLILTTFFYPWRFDLFPVLLTALALWRLLSGRPAWAGVWLGLAVAAKLYPIVLAPVFALYFFTQAQSRSAWRFLAALTAAVGAIALPVVWVISADAITFIIIQFQRGLQVETIAAGLLELAGLAGIISLAPVSAGYYWVVQSPINRWVLAVLPVMFILLFSFMGWVAWRRFRREVQLWRFVQPLTLVKTSLGALTAFLICNKVLSPQHLIWLFPFGIFLSGRLLKVLVWVVMLTLPVYILLSTGALVLTPLPVLLLNLRNGLILALYFGLLADLARRTSSSEALLKG